MAEGWLKIHRKLCDWEWYSDANMLRVFLHLMLNAAHTEKPWNGVTLAPGQVPFGRKKAARILNISEQTIRTCLNRLKSTNEITIKSTNKYSIITILNWNYYQQSNQLDNQQSTSNQPATNHILRSKEDKKERKDIRPHNVSPEIWEDFKTHRKAKRAPVTQAALDGIQREAIKAGISLEDALKEMCARGWQGFKADWIKNANTGTDFRGYGKSGTGNAPGGVATGEAGKALAITEQIKRDRLAKAQSSAPERTERPVSADLCLIEEIR